MSGILSTEGRKRIDWLKDAACTKTGFSDSALMRIFFPPEDADYSLAKKICDACPVCRECLEAELQFPSGDQHGIFGGKTAETRKRMIHERAKVDRPRG